MRALVTGAAGFIGSHLSESLIDAGYDVVAVDSFTAYYDPSLKRANLERLRGDQRFVLHEIDLSSADLSHVVAGADVVFHLAGQPGVRASWGDGFIDYDRWNIVATQRLLEACRHAGRPRFVFSSSSSVYGQAERFPTNERDLPAPVSPYGVTKLAAEHLVSLYGTAFGVPSVSLRYFTVFGPRQRPDMAMNRLVRCALRQEPFPLNGDGSQVRDFTYVGDVVAANIAASKAPVAAGSVFNIGGGDATSLAEVIAHVESITGRSVPIEAIGRADGDPARTGADTARAREALVWTPKVSVREGLEHQVEWQRANLGS